MQDNIAIEREAFKERFATWLRKTLIREDMSNEAFARTIGKTGGAVTKYLSGEIGPSQKTLEKISRVYGISVDYFQFGEKTHYDKRNEIWKQIKTLDEEYQLADRESAELNVALTRIASRLKELDDRKATLKNEKNNLIRSLEHLLKD